ncbi:acyl-CoA thioesterase [Thermaurantiacus sp.]
MESSEAVRFRVPISPAAADIDALGHVNNAVYVRWLQEAGTAHWFRLASPQELERWIWLVARHEIDYRRPCHLGEALVAETWVDRPRGARFDRCVRILGPGDDVRAEARTTWVLVDRNSLRPARIPGDMIHRFFTQAVPPVAAPQG